MKLGEKLYLYDTYRKLLKYKEIERIGDKYIYVDLIRFYKDTLKQVSDNINPRFILYREKEDCEHLEILEEKYKFETDCIKYIMAKDFKDKDGNIIFKKDEKIEALLVKKSLVLVEDDYNRMFNIYDYSYMDAISWSKEHPRSSLSGDANSYDD